MGAENCNIQPGDTVAVWGCGPVAQFAIRSCFMLGAGRVIAIDRVPERLQMARDAGAETLNFDETDVIDALHDMTGNQGPDSCMDVVGMEASGHGVLFAVDRAKQMARIQMDRPTVLRQAIMACKKRGDRIGSRRTTRARSGGRNRPFVRHQSQPTLALSTKP
jgi:threonine dehydrogenase-like Zn-dependent dehydrogenase